MATKLDEDGLVGNAEDSLDKSASASNDLFDKKGNATSDELASLESDLDKKYSQDFDALDERNSGKEGSREALQSGEQNPEVPPSLYSPEGKVGELGGIGKLTAKLLAGSKKAGPTGGIIGLIFGLFGITSAIGAPMSLLTAFSDLTSNHADLGNHLFIKTGNSYIASMLTGKNRNCAESKIKCKFTTISEKRKAEWEKRGIKVDVDDKKNILGRYKVRGLEYKNTKVTSINGYKNLKYTNGEFNSLLKRFPVRAYLLQKSPFQRGALEKFNLKISDKFASSTEKEKAKRVEANNKAMNSKTKSPVGDGNRVTLEGIKAEAKSRVEAARAPVEERLKSLRTATKVASGVATGTVAACMAYDVIRAAQAAVTLYWHSKLIEFALPFLQAGAQSKEAGVNGGFDWETAEYYGDRLMDPITQKDVDDNPDLYSSDMIGKTAMDSIGMDAVINGSSVSTQGNYAQKYNGYDPSESVTGIGLVRDLQKMAGVDNIRTGCSAAKMTMLLSSVACLAGVIAALKCGFVIVAFNAFVEIFGDEILDLITNKIQEPAFEAIAAANLSASLTGPPLGQALVSATGVMSSYMDNASGFAYAGDDDQAMTAYSDMYSDDDFIAEAKQEAGKNQFDLSNPYSFASLATAKLGAVQWDGTLFSGLADVVKIAINGPQLATNVSAMQEGLYQPIEIYSSKEKIQGTLKNCKNPGLGDVAIPCLGESGRAVPTFLPKVQECLFKEAAGSDELCIEQAIDYLSKKTYKDTKNDDRDTSYIDDDTGEPGNWSQFKAGGQSEDDYDNPFLMFMEYCGRDRVYPLGYTARSIEDETDNWHTGLNCVAGKNTIGGDNDKVDDETLGWMSYYYNMCIAMYASEEDQDYCWSEEAAPQTGDVCSLLNNPHIHYEQKTTEEDLKKLCAGETVKSYCGNNIQINQDLINTLVSNSNKYDITINNFGFYDDRHVANDCQPGKQHWKGNAVDLSKVALINGAAAGTGGSGVGNGVYGGISYGGANGTLLSQYATDFLAGIPGNRGGVGQKGCSSTFNPTFPSGSTNVNGAAFFEDACNHLHIDVRDRTNLSGL